MNIIYKCQICGKEISEDEYVVNWCSCAECFDKPRYEKEREEKREEEE